MRLLIVDDDNLVCTSLKIILETDPEITVVGVGHDGGEAVSLYDELHPDILLMDIRMKEMLGLTAAEKILRKYPDAKILFLTTFSDEEYIVKALHCGAKGYLLKQDYDSLVPALKAVNIGQSVFGSDIVQMLPSMMDRSDDVFNGMVYGLSGKECQIVEYIAEGFSNKEIAAKTFLSEGTVRNYLSTILEKLELRDRTQLAVFYYKHRK